MEIKQVLVTPELAKDFLGNNTINRQIKESVVLRYAEDMISGRWKENTGEFIKVSSDGVLLDGQHRMMAVIKANKPIAFSFAYGLSKDIFDVLDTGVKRTASDTFSIGNVKSASRTASIINFYLTLRLGLAYYRSKNNTKLTNSVLLAEYNKNPTYYDHISSVACNLSNQFSNILVGSVIGGLYLFLNDINQDYCERFMNQLCTGMDIENKSIVLLRNKLINDKMAVSKLPKQIITALILKTWNNFRSNREVKLLVFDSKKEEFPKAI